MYAASCNMRHSRTAPLRRGVLQRSLLLVARDDDARRGQTRAPGELMASLLGASAFTGTPLRAATQPRASSSRAGFCCTAAATKATKTETLQRLQSKLAPEAATMFVAGLNFKGFTVRLSLRPRGGTSSGRARWKLARSLRGGMLAGSLPRLPALARSAGGQITGSPHAGVQRVTRGWPGALAKT